MKMCSEVFQFEKELKWENPGPGIRRQIMGYDEQLMMVKVQFEKGADGVIMCGCHPGDCHYTTGNYYARRRMTLLFSMLDFIGVENGRTRVEWVSAAEGVKFSQTMNEFVEKIHSLGKNVRLEDLRCRN